MSDNMQSTDEILDDESPDAKATEAYEEVEEFDPFEGMSDEELDALCDEDDSLAGFGDVEPGFRSGFVALVGRPNAGKSTLLNACYGKKVAITSPVAQTTRRRMRAAVNRPGYQLVFVDTPGIHKPKDGLGSELNKSALFELNDVDVVAFLIDATKLIGRGDAWVAERVKNARSKKVLVLTKADEADPAQVMEQLKAAHELMDFDDEIVCFDIETTGLKVQREAITEIGAVVLKNGKITDTFQTFVNPGRRLTPEIIGLTGITDAMLSGAPSPKEALTAFLDFVGGAPWRPTTPNLTSASSGPAAAGRGFPSTPPMWTP